jgi:hypothetical protein
MVATTAVALSIVFPLLAIFAVLGRFYSRKVKSLDIQPDDWAIIPGLVCYKRSLAEPQLTLTQICGVGMGVTGLIGMYRRLSSFHMLTTQVPTMETWELLSPRAPMGMPS